MADLEGNTCERAWEHAAALALQPGGRSAGKGANEGLQAESAAEGKASLAAETAKAPVRGYRAFRREHARKRAESR